MINMLRISTILSLSLLFTTTSIVNCQILGDDSAEFLPPNNSSAVNATIDSSPKVNSNLTAVESSSADVTSTTDSHPSTIDKQFLATWKLESSENFEEFLKELGVGYFYRKVAAMTKQMVTYFRYSDGDYGIKVTSRIYNRTIRFKLGQEFWDEAPGGIKLRSVFTVNGDSLVQLMFADKTAKVTRRIKGDRMMVESRIGDVICTRVYKRID